MLKENRRSGIVVDEPLSAEERAAVAASCAAGLRMRMPIALDGLDNVVASTYGGWPDRMYLVGSDGRIVYRGGEGPFGFKPEELEEAVERELGLAV